MAIPSGYSLLGRIGYNDRGVYSENNEYVRGDVVYHEGSSYVALTTVTGVTPADDNTNWKYLARGFGATELSEIDATDTSGFAGDAGKKVKGQTLIDKIAEYVMNKVVATDAFQTYLQKFLVDNCVTERSDLSLSAAQGKALQDQLATLNSNLNSLIKIVEVGVTDAIPINPSSKEVNTSISFQKSYTDPIVIATLCGGQGYVGAGCKVMSVKNNGATFKTYTTSPVGSDYSFYISYLVVVKNNQFKLA